MAFLNSPRFLAVTFVTFLVVVTKYLMRRNSGEKGFTLGSQFEGDTVQHGREGLVVGCEAPSHTVLAVGVKKHRTGARLETSQQSLGSTI